MPQEATGERDGSAAAPPRHPRGRAGGADVVGKDGRSGGCGRSRPPFASISLSLSLSLGTSSRVRAPSRVWMWFRLRVAVRRMRARTDVFKVFPSPVLVLVLSCACLLVSCRRSLCRCLCGAARRPALCSGRRTLCETRAREGERGDGMAVAGRTLSPGMRRSVAARAAEGARKTKWGDRRT